MRRLLVLADHLGKRGWLTVGFLYCIVQRTLRDGFIHAGNIAYLSLVTLFPAAILVYAAMATLGRTDAGTQAISQFLATLPVEVASFVQPVLDEVLAARSGPALAAGGLVALWTTSGFIGTLSDLLRRAHKAPASRAFWQQRLFAILITLGGMAVILFAFIGRHVAQWVMDFILPYLSIDDFAYGEAIVQRMSGLLAITGGMGIAMLFLMLWALFRVLTPPSVLARRTPVWPGPALVTVVWVGTTALLGPIMANAANFSLTYGAVAGVILAMLFFYIIGLAMVAGAETNATLASKREVVEMVVRWRRFAAGYARLRPAARERENQD